MRRTNHREQSLIFIDVGRYLLAENLHVVVYERRSEAGGVWNYTTIEDDFATPIYDELETNVPRSMMTYSNFPWNRNTSLFPKHEVVKQYLESYAAHLPINYNTEVSNARQIMVRRTLRWEITTRSACSKERTEVNHFDAMVVAAGNYDTIHEPVIEGLEDWKSWYPGTVSHSKTYRRPSDFRDKARASMKPEAPLLTV